jgi:hypothetical protein
MIKNLKGGEDVKLLIDDQDAKEILSEETYTFIESLDKHTAKIINQTGIPLNVHKSRIRRGEEKMEEKQVTTTTKTKKTKVKPKVEEFNVLEWRKNCGGECLHKQCTFDHDNYKLNAIICINEDTGYYHTINTYEYTD